MTESTTHPIARFAVRKGVLKMLHVEKALGFKLARGISKQRGRCEIPEIRALLTDIDKFNHKWFRQTEDFIKWSPEVAADAEKLFHRHGAVLWPDDWISHPDFPRPAWLTSARTDNLDNWYPRDLYYSDSRDREELQKSFYAMMVMKCLQYRKNHLNSVDASSDLTNAEAQETGQRIQQAIPDPMDAPPENITDEMDEDSDNGWPPSWERAGRDGSRDSDDDLDPVKQRALPRSKRSWDPAILKSRPEERFTLSGDRFPSYRLEHSLNNAIGQPLSTSVSAKRRLSHGNMPPPKRQQAQENVRVIARSRIVILKLSPEKLATFRTGQHLTQRPSDREGMISCGDGSALHTDGLRLNKTATPALGTAPHNPILIDESPPVSAEDSASDNSAKTTIEGGLRMPHALSEPEKSQEASTTEGRLPLQDDRDTVAARSITTMRTHKQSKVTTSSVPKPVAGQTGTTEAGIRDALPQSPGQLGDSTQTAVASPSTATFDPTNRPNPSTDTSTIAVMRCFGGPNRQHMDGRQLAHLGIWLGEWDEVSEMPVGPLWDAVFQQLIERSASNRYEEESAVQVTPQRKKERQKHLRCAACRKVGQELTVLPRLISCRKYPELKLVAWMLPVTNGSAKVAAILRPSSKREFWYFRLTNGDYATNLALVRVRRAKRGSGDYEHRHPVHRPLMAKLAESPTPIDISRASSIQSASQPSPRQTKISNASYQPTHDRHGDQSKSPFTSSVTSIALAKQSHLGSPASPAQRIKSESIRASSVSQDQDQQDASRALPQPPPNNPAAEENHQGNATAATPASLPSAAPQPTTDRSATKLGSARPRVSTINESAVPTPVRNSSTAYTTVVAPPSAQVQTFRAPTAPMSTRVRTGDSESRVLPLKSFIADFRKQHTLVEEGAPSSEILPCKSSSSVRTTGVKDLRCSSTAAEQARIPVVAHEAAVTTIGSSGRSGREAVAAEPSSGTTESAPSHQSTLPGEPTKPSEPVQPSGPSTATAGVDTVKAYAAPRISTAQTAVPLPDAAGSVAVSPGVPQRMPLTQNVTAAPRVATDLTDKSEPQGVQTELGVTDTSPITALNATTPSIIHSPVTQTSTNRPDYASRITLAPNEILSEPQPATVSTHTREQRIDPGHANAPSVNRHTELSVEARTVESEPSSMLPPKSTPSSTHHGSDRVTGQLTGASIGSGPTATETSATKASQPVASSVQTMVDSVGKQATPISADPRTVGIVATSTPQSQATTLSGLDSTHSNLGPSATTSIVEMTTPETQSTPARQPTTAGTDANGVDILERTTVKINWSIPNTVPGSIALEDCPTVDIFFERIDEQIPPELTGKAMREVTVNHINHKGDGQNASCRILRDGGRGKSAFRVMLKDLKKWRSVEEDPELYLTVAWV